MLQIYIKFCDVINGRKNQHDRKKFFVQIDVKIRSKALMEAILLRKFCD
jgi:hypothetical protein